MNEIGLLWIYLMPPMRYHDAMLMALVKRWNVDTCTFHLPSSKMIVTLEDVHRIFRVPIHGHVVYFKEVWSYRQMRGDIQYCLDNPQLQSAWDHMSS